MVFCSVEQSNLDPLLQSVARTFYLSLTYLPKAICEPMSLAYLLARLSDTIVDAQLVPFALRQEALSSLKVWIQNPQNESHFNEIERQMTLCTSYFFDQDLALIQHTQVLIARFLAQPEAIQTLIQEVLTWIFTGQEKDLTYFDRVSGIGYFKTPEELDHYLYLVAGCVGEFWTKLGVLCIPNFSTKPLDMLLPKAVAFGKALQLTNILKDFPHDLLQGRCYLPVPHMQFSESFRIENNPQGLVNQVLEIYPTLIQDWRTQALNYLEDAQFYTQAMGNRRIRFSVMVPMHLAYKTLLSIPEKVSKKTVYSTLLFAFVRCYTPFLGAFKYD